MFIAWWLRQAFCLSKCHSSVDGPNLAVKWERFPPFCFDPSGCDNARRVAWRGGAVYLGLQYSTDRCPGALLLNRQFTS